VVLGFLLGQADLSTLKVYGIYFKQTFSPHEEGRTLIAFSKAWVVGTY